MISPFSSLFELLASISILFVTIEYVESFTHKICDKLYGITGKVKDTFEDCKSILTDIQTISKMRPVEIDGKSTEMELEACKRTNEKLRSDIDNKQEQFIKGIPKFCSIQYMPSVCLMMFLMSLMFLFFGGIEDKHTIMVPQVAFWMALLSLGYVYVGCIKGDNILKYYSLRNSICATIWIIVISLVLMAIGHFFTSFGDIIVKLAEYIIPGTIVLYYFAYVASLLQIGNKGNKYLSELKKEGESLQKQCEEAENKLKVLKDVDRLKESLVFVEPQAEQGCSRTED